MNKQLIAALVELEKEKGIKMDTIIEALELALASAYKRNYQVEYECRIDIDTKYRWDPGLQDNRRRWRRGKQERGRSHSR